MNKLYYHDYREYTEGYIENNNNAIQVARRPQRCISFYLYISNCLQNLIIEFTTKINDQSQCSACQDYNLLLRRTIVRA